MDWNTVCLRFAVKTPNLERLRIIVPFGTFCDLGMGGHDVQLLVIE